MRSTQHELREREARQERQARQREELASFDDRKQRWGKPEAWEYAVAAWEHAQATYQQDAPAFTMDEETFTRFATESAEWDRLTTSNRHEVERYAADFLLACTTFPFRLVGERLLAWDGTLWCEDPRAVLSSYRQWYDHTLPANQYALLAPYPGKVESRTRQPDGSIRVHYAQEAGRPRFPIAHQRITLGEVVIEMLRTWYQRPEQAVKVLTEVMASERDDADRLFHEDPLGWLNTPGGAYDLEHGRVVTDDAERRALHALHVTKTVVGTLDDCPEFLRVLARVLPDPAVRAYFQRLMGYAATGEFREDVVVWCLGDGGAGKTTIVGAVQSALGSYAEQEDRTAILLTSRKPPKLDPLRGKRLVVMAEMERKYHIDTGRLKQLSGGNDAPGSGDGPRWEPQFTFVVEANHMPHLGDTSDATRRRLKVIPFDVVIPEAERDTRLRRLLREREAPGVLAWILDGARHYYQSGLGPTPPAVKRATDLVFAQDDPERAFYRMLTRSTTPVPFTVLYDELARLCSQANRPLPAKRLVSARLASEGFAVKRGHARKLEVYATLDGADTATVPDAGEMVA